MLKSKIEMRGHMEKDFSKLSTSDELQAFLKERGSKHQAYHHYTSFTTLKKILEGGQWKLSNPERMNDLQERQEKGSEEYWRRSVFASFGYGESENMAMWGLYCFPRNEAVRISLPRKLMKAWLSDAVLKYDQDQLMLSDVVYVNNPENKEHQLQMRWNNKKADITDLPLLNNLSHLPEMTGLVKNEAWSYENEVRFLMRLKTPAKDGIFVSLPLDFAKHLRVKLGPWMDQEASHRAKLLLNQLGVASENITESIFTGKVHLDNKCETCEYYLNAEFIKD